MRKTRMEEHSRTWPGSRPTPKSARFLRIFPVRNDGGEVHLSRTSGNTHEDREIENRQRYAPARHAARVANFSSCVHGGPRLRPIRARRAVSCSEERWSA